MVYVDKREYKYRGMIMSHMAADTINELHSMAESIGVQKSIFKTKKESLITTFANEIN